MLLENKKSSILFLVFNRPQTTTKVFEEIRKYKPTKLYVAADGPRKDSYLEIEKCKNVRNIIKIDWDCELKTLYRDENLGCKMAVYSAISWFFDHEEEGIILEDDCLPSQSFFIFCQTMLHSFRYNEKVFHINGFTYASLNSDYYFTNLPLVWGWASWRRAWAKYDIEMKEIKTTFKMMDKIKGSNFFNSSMMKLLALEVYFNEINTWDVQWNFSIIKNQGLCVQTGINFISNIGFGADATHTLSVHDLNSNTKTFESNNFINFEPEIDIIISKQSFILDKQFNRSFKGKIKQMVKYYMFLLRLKFQIY